MVDYSEIMEVCDIKVGIYSKLTEYMEIYMYQRSSLFFDRILFDLCIRSLRMKLDLRCLSDTVSLVLWLIFFFYSLLNGMFALMLQSEYTMNCFMAKSVV